MTLSNPAARYCGAHFGLLTQHGKEAILAPALAQRWQARLTHSDAFDTDTLGTFSGEVERRLSPIDCALHKARLAVELTGAEFGLGSEGSFTTAPWGFGVVNQELVACVSAREGWQVIGRHFAPVAVDECRFGDGEWREHFWRRLPAGQGVIVSAAGHIAKGIRSEADAMAQLQRWFGAEIPADVRITYDLRAHQSPLRRETIALAVTNLLQRMDSPCDACGLPGFWPDQRVAGLPCRDCGEPTHSLSASVARCETCGHEQRYAVAAVAADPANCPRCNP